MKLWAEEQSLVMAQSPLSRGRGLKPSLTAAFLTGYEVAPLAGAWIETGSRRRMAICVSGRPSRGGVD